jgi:phytoene synthase
MKEVMRKYSTTFFECMKDWPEHIKQDIYKLYAYLRVCDEVVEGQEDYSASEKMKITKEFHEVFDRYEMEGKWLDSFHHAMLTDLNKKKHTIVSMLEYCKGSSETVGLMMSRILGCPPEADEYAKALGRAYQIINFVRDYEEDIKKGYHYIGEDHTLYLLLFIEELETAMEGINYIPEDLRGPIIKANQAYIEVAREANLL